MEEIKNLGVDRWESILLGNGTKKEIIIIINNKIEQKKKPLSRIEPVLLECDID